MKNADFDRRLERLTDTLARMLDGEFEDLGEVTAAPEDPLGRIEETVQDLVLDAKTAALAQREKEAALVLQHEQLVERRAVLDEQRRRIEAQERELAKRAATIEAQASAIRELSTPILELWRDVLVLPIIGSIHEERAVQITEALLGTIAARKTRWVIIDVTGVDVVDTQTADHLIRVVRSAALLGTSCMLTGLRPSVAQTLVSLGVSLDAVHVERNLERALLRLRLGESGARA